MIANIAQRNARRMAASIQRFAATPIVARSTAQPVKATSPLSIRSALRSFHTEKPPARTVFSPLDTFARRHNGPSQGEIKEMLSAIGLKDMDGLTGKTIPDRIRSTRALALDHGFTEKEVLERLKHIASKNKVFKNYIGMGYTDVVVPNVILRNVMENPGWYVIYYLFMIIFCCVAAEGSKGNRPERKKKKKRGRDKSIETRVKSGSDGGGNVHLGPPPFILCIHMEF